MRAEGHDLLWERRTDACPDELVSGLLEQGAFDIGGVVVIGAPRNQGEHHPGGTRFGYGTTADGLDPVVLPGQGRHNAARLVQVGLVMQAKVHATEDAPVLAGLVDDRLGGDQAVGHYDLPIVIGLQDRVAQVDTLDDAGFQPCWRGHLETVPDFERAIEHQRNPGYQVAQCVLGGQTDDDGDDADPGQPGRSEVGQGGDDVGVGNERQEIDPDLGQLPKELHGSPVHEGAFVVGQNAVDGQAQGAADDPGGQSKEHSIEHRPQQRGGIIERRRDRRNWAAIDHRPRRRGGLCKPPAL